MFGRSTVWGSTSSLPVIAVAIWPGATALTVIPCGASSSATFFVMPPSACLAVV
jgi:hypothetical protein